MEYKLKQWYPGLPKDWKPGCVIVKVLGCGICYARTTVTDPYNEIILSSYDVEENPDFWEKIPEKLFTTDDGYEVYSGQSWYYVKEGSDVVSNTSTLEYKGNNRKPVKKFKNKTNAEIYATMNKLNSLLVSCDNDSKITIYGRRLKLEF